jgi:hypothetical protein
VSIKTFFFIALLFFVICGIFILIYPPLIVLFGAFALIGFLYLTITMFLGMIKALDMPIDFGASNNKNENIRSSRASKEESRAFNMPVQDSGMGRGQARDGDRLRV